MFGFEQDEYLFEEVFVDNVVFDVKRMMLDTKGQKVEYEVLKLSYEEVLSMYASSWRVRPERSDEHAHAFAIEISQKLGFIGLL